MASSEVLWAALEKFLGDLGKDSVRAEETVLVPAGNPPFDVILKIHAPSGATINLGQTTFEADPICLVAYVLLRQSVGADSTLLEFVAEREMKHQLGHIEFWESSDNRFDLIFSHTVPAENLRAGDVSHLLTAMELSVPSLREAIGSRWGGTTPETVYR